MLQHSNSGNPRPDGLHLPPHVFTFLSTTNDSYNTTTELPQCDYISLPMACFCISSGFNVGFLCLSVTDHPFLLTMNKLDLKLAAFLSLVSCARLCDARDYFITCLVSQPTLRASNLFCHSLGRLNSKDTDAIARPCSIYADAQITCFALRLSGNAYELLRNFKGTTCVP